jgi:1,4-alpha-glucan branching enzyme
VPRTHYRVGVPVGGPWREVFNSDSALYGGSNLGNGYGVTALAQRHGSQPCTLELTLPPLAAVLLKPA